MRRLVLQAFALLPLPLVAALIYASVERPPVAPMQRGHRSGGKGMPAGEPRAAAGVSLPAQLPSGWKVQGRVTRYTPKTLFDRIDGAAPAYIRAGYVGSQGVEWVKVGFSDAVTMDVYDMGGSARALGMYAAERDPSYRFVEVGGEGYLASGSLNFWSGRYYVKIAGFEVGEAMDRGLTELARDLASLLPAAGDLAAVKAGLASLPASEQLPHSAGYSHGALEDIKGLEGAYFARYGKQEQDAFRLFVVAGADAAETSRRLVAVAGYFKEFEAAVEEQQQDGEKQMTIRGQSATQLVTGKGRWLVGAVDLTSEGQVKAAREKISEHVKAMKDAG